MENHGNHGSQGKFGEHIWTNFDKLFQLKLKTFSLVHRRDHFVFTRKFLE